MPIDPTRRGAGESAAKSKIAGSISNGITWVQDIEITEDGTAIAGTPEDWTWTLTLRADPDGDTADLSLSTDDGTLAISQGTDSTVLQIRVARASLSNLGGNYVCDIRSLDTTDTTVDSEGLSEHWGHGMLLVNNEPI